MIERHVFITGGTGYVGQALIPRLLERGHRVRALARSASQRKLPSGCEVVIGNALVASTFADRVKPSDTFVQLVGVPHPSPSKAAEFQSVDLASTVASVAAATDAGVEHFVYVSVAQPAPVMKAYQAARAAGEKAIRESGLAATILRPWYVLGPGHRWAHVLLPLYKLFELIPGTRSTALRLGLVTLDQMVAALVHAIESSPDQVRIVDVPSIRNTASQDC